MRLYPSQQPGRGKRLGDEIGRAHAERGHLEASLGMTRDKDDWHAQRVRCQLQCLKHLETAHSGQLGVQQDEIRRGVVYQLQRLLTAGGEAQFTDTLQDTGYQIDRTRVVINDYYFIVHEIDCPLRRSGTDTISAPSVNSVRAIRHETGRMFRQRNGY